MFRAADIVLFINPIQSLGLKAGAPALFLEWNDRVVLFEAPTIFLAERYVRSGAQQSPHTWAKAAYALKSWFQYLQAVDKDWQDASEEDRISYREAFLSAISPKTGHLYGVAGIRDNMTVIREFHKFCSTKDSYFGDIGKSQKIEFRTPIDRDFLAHIQSSPRSANRDYALPKVRPAMKLHPIMATDLKGLLNHVGPQAAHRDGDLRPARDRLIFDLGWAVGLRLDEINRLTTLQFLSLVPDVSSPFTNLPVTIYHGKGKKTRQVGIPTWLVMDLLAYIVGERAVSLRACKSVARSKPINLLLAHATSKAPGHSITNSAIQKMFRQACLTLGIVETVQKEVPLSGLRFLTQVPKHSIHDLRHTYAVLTYHAERANGNSEPWKKIQAQLGHRHLQTTIDTYLSHVEIFTDQPGLFDVRKMLGL